MTAFSLHTSSFLLSFDLIADAPNGIARLRELILQLAVHGELVPQVAGEEDATVLLDRISDGGENPARGRGRRTSGFPPVDATRVPYPLPSSWVWARFGQVAAIRSNLVPPDEFGHLPHVAPDNIEKNSGRLLDCATVADDDVRSANHLFREGQILYSKIRPRLNKVTIAPFDGLCSADMYPVDARIDTHYLALYMLSGAFLSMSVRDDTRVAMPKINQEKLNMVLVAVPPLPEQKRIVAKVDELMKRCDALAARQQTRNERRTALVSACLHALTTPPERPPSTRQPSLPGLNTEHRTLNTAFSPAHSPDFILHPSTFNLLFTTPETVRELRRTILQLAVQGRLVPQDTNDGPVSVLLGAVDAERTLVAGRDRRADADTQPTMEDELRWSVPATWAWRGLGDLALFIDYRGKTPTKVQSGIRLITAKNVRKGSINLEPEEFITDLAYETWMTRGIPRKGDVLFTTEAPMGNAAVIDIDEVFALAQRTICFRLYAGIDPAFTTLQVLSPLFQAILAATATGLTAKGVKAAKLKRLPFAVPPLAEQKRIVAKVNELIALCDALEAKLSQAREDADTLAAAVVHQLGSRTPPATETPAVVLEEKAPGGRLLGFVEGVEKCDRDVAVTLDAAMADRVTRLPPGGPQLYAAISDMPSYRVDARISHDDFGMLLHRRMAPHEGDWYEIQRRDDGVFGGIFYDGDTEAPVDRTHFALARLSKDELGAVQRRIRLPEEAQSEDAVGKVLSGVPPVASAFVAVYNVGQGLCCAICDRGTCAPLIYVDFGAGCYQNARTRPRSMRFCFTAQPPVVLSHWDTDHYAAARWLDPRAQDMKWIAPLQPVGPTTAKFAAALHLRGNLTLWADGARNSALFGCGSVMKCTGVGSNDSGLAVFAHRRNSATRRVLLPGDARYDVIPRLASSAIDALVVSHHGGLSSGTVPRPVAGVPSPSFALSYGVENSYEHPRDWVVQAHLDAGWSRRLDTIGGHIALGAPGLLPSMGLGCRGQRCDLAIAQA